MHATTTTTPSGLPGGKRPGWAQRHPFWAAFLGGFAAVAVLTAAFSAWLIAGAPSPAFTARPAASTPAVTHHRHHHARPAPAKTVYVTPPAPQAAAPAPAAPAPVQPGAYGPYLDDLKMAGIVAPDQWA